MLPSTLDMKRAPFDLPAPFSFASLRCIPACRSVAEKHAAVRRRTIAGRCRRVGMSDTRGRCEQRGRSDQGGENAFHGTGPRLLGVARSDAIDGVKNSEPARAQKQRIREDIFL